MNESSRSVCSSYTPTNQDYEKLSNLEVNFRRFYSYWNARKIDPFMVNVVRGYFYDSLIACVEKHRKNPIDSDSLNKKAFVTLFEAWLIIGSLIGKNSTDDEFLAHSADIFANAFLSREVDPRNPDTGLKYSADRLLPKTGIATTTIDGDDNWQKSWQVRKPGDIVLLDFPSLFWQLTLKEAVEFAILKGYPEHLFTDLLSDAPIIETTSTTEIKDSETSQTQNNGFADFDKVLDSRERMSLYKIIAALCEMAKVAPFDAGLAKDIQLIIESKGFSLKEKAIRKYLDTINHLELKE